MSRIWISLALPTALLACAAASAEPLPARLDAATISAHQENMASTETRVWGVNIADASGAVDSEIDIMIALPAGERNYHAAFYRSVGNGRYERVGAMLTFTGTRPPRLSNHGALAPCLAAPAVSGSGTIKWCAIDGTLRRFSQ